MATYSNVPAVSGVAELDYSATVASPTVIFSVPANSYAMINLRVSSGTVQLFAAAAFTNGVPITSADGLVTGVHLGPGQRLVVPVGANAVTVTGVILTNQA